MDETIGRARGTLPNHSHDKLSVFWCARIHVIVEVNICVTVAMGFPAEVLRPGL